MRISIASLAFVTIIFAGNAGAGDKKSEVPAVPRGPEHKVLDSLVGTYEAKVKLYLDPKGPPQESVCVLTRKLILDGNFLQEHFTGKFLGKDFTGMGMIGYDAVKKKYVAVWFDNMSTSTSLMQGTYDADKKSLTTVGEDADAKGKKMKARDVLTIISADEQLFEMYRQPGGSTTEIKIMEITYTRKK